MARIQHRIGVQAPPEVIWEVIYDLAGWAGWNPIHPRAEGQIRIGGQLTLTLALPGRAHRTIRPTVLDWVPNEQLHWRAAEWGGLARSIRFVEIEKLAEENCIVSTGELVEGVMASMALRQNGGALQRGFAAMNEALKARAETLWRERRPATTSDA